MTGPDLLAKGLELLALAENADGIAEPEQVALTLSFAFVAFAGAHAAATADAGLKHMDRIAASKWLAVLEGERTDGASEQTSEEGS